MEIGDQKGCSKTCNTYLDVRLYPKWYLGLAITMFEPAHDSKVESTPQKSKVYNDVLKENFREKRIWRALNFTIES